MALFLVSAASAGPALAQGGPTGALSGTVQDSSGGVIPGAEVQIISSATSSVVRSVTTNADGAFSAQLLPAGTYQLIIRAQGFAEGRVSNIEVRVTETTRVAATLRVGAVRTDVQVSAEVTTVETSSAVTGQSIEANTIRTLPLATQNFQQLLSLSAGAGSDLNASGALGRGDVNITVNGQREDNNNYLIEGISATDYNIGFLRNTPLPSPDVIQEFKVQTSLYDASQGRNGGGNIDAILKSGTKDFHGDLFEFFRNNVFNANDFFFNAAGQPRPDIKQNIFGGSIGGPIGHEAKLGYFFFNYQGTRQHSGLSAGTFISTQIPVLPLARDATTLQNTFFPAGLPPGITQLDPVVVALLNLKGNQFGPGAGGGWLIPTVAGTPGGMGPLTISRAGKYDDDQLSLNLDRDFRGGNDRVLGRFFWSNFSSFLPFGGGGLPVEFGNGISPFDLNFPFFLPVHNRFVTVGETHVFSPQWVNDARFGYVHISNDMDNVQIVDSSQLGIIRPNGNVTTNIYKFQLAASGFQIGPAGFANIAQIQDNFTVLDTVSWNRGHHSVRFGGQSDRVNLDKNFPQLFNGLGIFVPTRTGPGGSLVSDFQNFLIGAPVVVGGASGVFNHEYRINSYALFAQDDYKVLPRLTLNIGLRWEANGAIRDNLDHISNPDPRLALLGQNPWRVPKGASRYNVPGLVANASETTLDNDYASNWGPRFGFAYDVFGHGTTVIRGGYGIYYGREDLGAVDNLSFGPPFLAGFFVPPPPGTLATLFSSSGPLPPGGVISPALVPQLGVLQGFVMNGTMTPTTDTTQTPVFSGKSEFLITLSLPRKFLSPNTQQWNLGVQRELPWKWVLEVGYAGAKGTHLRVTRDTMQATLVKAGQTLTVNTVLNGPLPITQNTTANAAARSPVLGLNPLGFQVFDDAAWSNYHALQLTLSRRAGNFYFQGAYTFSKALDATSTGNTAFNTAFNDQTNLRNSYGLSDYDRKHRLVVSYVYDFPFFSSATGPKAALLKGWYISGIVTFQSGRPFTVLDSAGGSAYQLISPSSTASIVPGKTVADALTHGSIESRLSAYLKASAFQPAPVDPNSPDFSTDYGNLGRNIFRGPFQQNWDFSIGKNFRLTERQNFKFTAEFFNIWNHPNFNVPTFVDIQSGPAFGAITSTLGTPRLVQLAAKYSF
jgi:hypothetical protein